MNPSGRDRENPLHAKRRVQWMQRHQRDDGAAVWVGDDAVMFCHIRAVDFRHHERHSFLHAKGAGIIHHHRAGLHGGGRKFFADAATGTEERDVHARKRIAVKFAHGDLFAIETHALARAALGGERHELAHGESSRLQHAEHRLPHRAGHAHHGHVVFAFTHLLYSGARRIAEKCGESNWQKGSCRVGWCGSLAGGAMRQSCGRQCAGMCLVFC